MTTREIVRVANETERAILAPHIQAHRTMLACARAIVSDPRLRFDPDTCSWYRDVREAEPENGQEAPR